MIVVGKIPKNQELLLKNPTFVGFFEGKWWIRRGSNPGPKD